MKYLDSNFFEISNPAFDNLANSKISTSAKWLYTVLKRLEHRFAGKNEDFFFRSIDELSKDSSLSKPTITKSLKELEQNDLIQKWQMHWWMDKEKTKKSEKHITAFRILD